MTHALVLQRPAAARGVRRRFIPALPTLWPGMLSPLAAARPPAFPLAAPRVTRFYLARNAVFHAVGLLGLEGREVLVPAYHHGVESRRSPPPAPSRASSGWTPACASTSRTSRRS